jgi:hypothetical protein
MSTNLTLPDEAPREFCNHMACGRITATITGSPAAMPSSMKGVRKEVYSRASLHRNASWR